MVLIRPSMILPESDGARIHNCNNTMRFDELSQRAAR